MARRKNRTSKVSIRGRKSRVSRTQRRGKRSRTSKVQRRGKRSRTSKVQRRGKRSRTSRVSKVQRRKNRRNTRNKLRGGSFPRPTLQQSVGELAAGSFGKWVTGLSASFRSLRSYPAGTDGNVRPSPVGMVTRKIDEEKILSRWTAEELHSKVGDILTPQIIANAFDMKSRFHHNKLMADYLDEKGPNFSSVDVNLFADGVIKRELMRRLASGELSPEEEAEVRARLAAKADGK